MTIDDELREGLQSLARQAGDTQGLAPAIRRAATQRRRRRARVRVGVVATGSVGALAAAGLAWRASRDDAVRTGPAESTTQSSPSTSAGGSSTSSPTSVPTSTPIPVTATNTSANEYVAVGPDGAINSYDPEHLEIGRLVPPVEGRQVVGLAESHGVVTYLSSPGACHAWIGRVGDPRSPIVNGGLYGTIPVFAVSPDGQSLAWVVKDCTSQSATLMVQMANASTVRELFIGIAPPSVQDLALSNDGQLALGLASSSANAETVSVLSPSATSVRDAVPVRVADGCEAARPRYLPDGSLTLLTCNNAYANHAMAARVTDPEGSLTKLFDIPGAVSGHLADYVTSFDWNDDGTDTLFSVGGKVYLWNAVGGVTDTSTITHSTDFPGAQLAAF